MAIIILIKKIIICNISPKIVEFQDTGAKNIEKVFQGDNRKLNIKNKKVAYFIHNYILQHAFLSFPCISGIAISIQGVLHNHFYICVHSFAPINNEANYNLV